MPRGFRNTRRENRLEELGRVDAERARTRKGKRNLREEKDRIRSELAVGGSVLGRAGRKMMTPDRKKKPKKLTGDHPLIKAMAGGVKGKPHSSKEGRMSAAGRKFDRLIKKGLGKTVSPAQPDLSQIKKHMKKYKTPLRKGGSAKKPRPTGPHMWVRGDKRKKYAAGSIVKGAIKGAKKIAKGLGSGIKPSEAKEILKTPGKSWKKTRSKYLKEHSPHFGGTRKKYASGGAVMAGKKVGCQIK